MGGVPASMLLGEAAEAAPASGFTFVQISDSHIGFNKAPQPAHLDRRPPPGRLTLWDEATGWLVSFRDLRGRAP
jgi:hypothetical protein